MRSREQYRLIAETTRAIPFELDLAHGRFTYVGPQAEAMLGIPEAAWKQSGFLDELLPRARESNTRRELDECVPGTFETLNLNFAVELVDFRSGAASIATFGLVAAAGVDAG